MSNRNSGRFATMVGGLASLCLFAAAGARADPTRPMFDASDPHKSAFPSDLFTVRDRQQLTGRRINLPLPDCAAAPSDCAELQLLNKLDGFNLQPRLSIPFSGPIDPRTVSSATLFLIRLVQEEDGERGEHQSRDVVGINQVIWDPASNTLHAKADQHLRQHSRYLMVATNGIRDASGARVERAEEKHGREADGEGHDALHEYRERVQDALEQLRGLGVRRRDVVAASLFTTQSITALLEKVRDRAKSAVPPPARFDIAVNQRGETVPAVFDLADIPSQPRNSGVRLFAQTSADPAAPLREAPVTLDQGREMSEGTLGKIAFGKYPSKDYESPQRFIPRLPTRGALPPAKDTDIYFNLLLPTGPKPAGGWPVAIYIHGTNVTKETALLAVAGRMALHGLATIGINGVGHGFGPKGIVKVTTASGEFTLPSGGRGIDQDGNGVIDNIEGLFAFGQVLINRSDGDRQTAIDLIHLVRAIEVGMDVDGDGNADLNASRIYCFGNSMGGFVGTLLLAVEPGVAAGGLAVTGASLISMARFTNDRGLIRAVLSGRQPTLLNALSGPASLLGFDENIPFRDQPPLVNTVAGATALQEFFERIEWADGAADPGAYAPHIRQHPLEGMPAKDVIVQFAKGDKTVPNPTTSAYLRAGNLKDRATYYRYDLVYPTLDAAEMAGRTGLTVAERNRAKNPHFFLSNLTSPPPDRAPKSSAVTFAMRDMALDQLGVFFASDGQVTIDPDGGGPFFETPIAGPLPEELNAIP